MNLDNYRTLFIVLLVCTIVMLAITVVLFFVLDIRRIISIKTGFAIKKSIKELEEINRNEDNKRRKKYKGHSIKLERNRITEEVGLENIKPFEPESSNPFESDNAKAMGQESLTPFESDNAKAMGQESLTPFESDNAKAMGQESLTPFESDSAKAMEPDNKKSFEPVEEMPAITEELEQTQATTVLREFVEPQMIKREIVENKKESCNQKRSTEYFEITQTKLVKQSNIIINQEGEA